MNQWLVLQILFCTLGLFGAEPTAEECAELVKPMSLADHSVMLGEKNLMMGFTNSKNLNAILEMTDSSWINVTSENDHVMMSEMLKINGTCYDLKVNFTMENDTASLSLDTMLSSFQMLPTCKSCIVIKGNHTVTEFKKFTSALKLNIDIEDAFTADSVYLYTEGLTVSDEDREHFVKQAKCLGFSGDVNFQYNPDKGVCHQGEGVKLPV